MDKPYAPNSIHSNDTLIQPWAVLPLTASARWVPSWLALLCGTLAAGAWRWQLESMLAWLLTLFLVEGLWPAWRTALVEVNWSAWAARYPPPQEGGRLPPLPYLTRQSLLGRAIDSLMRLVVWVRDVLPELPAGAWRTLPWLPLLILALSALLGRSLLLLSLAALALSGWEWLLERRGHSHTSLHACSQVALSWLAGHLLFAPLTVSSIVLACAYALAFQGILIADGSAFAAILLFGGQGVGSVILALAQRPVGALALVWLMVPQWGLWVNRIERRQLALGVNVAMLIAAWLI